MQKKTARKNSFLYSIRFVTRYSLPYAHLHGTSTKLDKLFKMHGAENAELRRNECHTRTLNGYHRTFKWVPQDFQMSTTGQLILCVAFSERRTQLKYWREEILLDNPKLSAFLALSGTAKCSPKNRILNDWWKIFPMNGLISWKLDRDLLDTWPPE